MIPVQETRAALARSTRLRDAELDAYLLYIDSVVRPTDVKQLDGTLGAFKHLRSAEGMTLPHLRLILRFAGCASTPLRASQVAQALARPGEHPRVFGRNGYALGSRAAQPFANPDTTELLKQGQFPSGPTLQSLMYDNLRNAAMETYQVQVGGAANLQPVTVSSTMVKDGLRDATSIINGVVLGTGGDKFLPSFFRSLPAGSDAAELGEFLSRFLNQNNLNEIFLNYLPAKRNAFPDDYSAQFTQHEAWQDGEGNWRIRTDFLTMSNNVMVVDPKGKADKADFPMAQLCSLNYVIAVGRAPDDLPYRLADMSANLHFMADPLPPAHPS